MNSVLAVTARAQPDTESMDQAHVRIGSAMAADAQLEELQSKSEELQSDDTGHSFVRMWVIVCPSHVRGKLDRSTQKSNYRSVK